MYSPSAPMFNGQVQQGWAVPAGFQPHVGPPIHLVGHEQVQQGWVVPPVVQPRAGPPMHWVGHRHAQQGLVMHPGILPPVAPPLYWTGGSPSCQCVSLPPGFIGKYPTPHGFIQKHFTPTPCVVPRVLGGPGVGDAPPVYNAGVNVPDPTSCPMGNIPACNAWVTAPDPTPCPPGNIPNTQGTDNPTVDSDTCDSGVGLGSVNHGDTLQQLASELPGPDQGSLVITLLRQVLQEQDKIKERVADLEQGLLGELSSLKDELREMIKTNPSPDSASSPVSPLDSIIYLA